MHASWRGDRVDWLTLCRSLVDAALHYAASDMATIDLPGAPSRHGQQYDGLEGFSRVFMTYAFGAVASDSPFDETHGRRWREGIVSGLAGERGSRRWPEARPKGHSIVDAGYIALALRVLGPTFLDRMTSEERELLFGWLEEHALAETPVNNWMLFRCVIVSALRHLAPERDLLDGVDEALELSIRSLDEWYEASTGWYSDGAAGTVDYYNSFEFHVIPPLLAYLDGHDGERERYGARLAQYLPSLSALVDAEGLPVYVGRSLVYRFAIGTPWAVAALLGLGGEHPARSRERLNQMVRAFLDRGAVAPDGTVLRGWFGSQADIAQPYSGPASGYFVGRAFLTLLLPPEHAFWARDPSPSVAEHRALIALPQQPHWLIDPAPDGSIVRVVNHGSNERVSTIMQQRFDSPLYSRLAFSTATAPAEAEGFRDRSAMVVVDGVPCSRGIIVPNHAGLRWMSSWSHPRTLEDRAVTGAVSERQGRDIGSVCLHHLTAVVEGWQIDVTAVRGEIDLVESLAHGGWAVPDAESTVVAHSWGRARVRMLSPRLSADFVALHAPRSSVTVLRSILAQPFGLAADFPVLVVPLERGKARRERRGAELPWMVTASRLEARGSGDAAEKPRPPRLRGRLTASPSQTGITLGIGTQALRVVMDDSGLRATT